MRDRVFPVSHRGSIQALLPPLDWLCGRDIKIELASKAGGGYFFFRVKKIPMMAPIRMIGAALTNSHSNE